MIYGIYIAISVYACRDESSFLKFSLQNGTESSNNLRDRVPKYGKMTIFLYHCPNRATKSPTSMDKTINIIRTGGRILGKGFQKGDKGAEICELTKEQNSCSLRKLAQTLSLGGWVALKLLSESCIPDF